MNERNKKIIELIICLRGELGHGFKLFKKKARHGGWESIQPVSPISGVLVSRNGTFGGRRDYCFGTVVLHPGAFFRLFRSPPQTGISESGEFPPMSEWSTELVCPCCDVQQWAELGWAASCHLPGFTWVLWISEQWWFFSLGRCCSHHPKSGLGHYLWCRKQMWCCPTLLPGVQDKTQTSQAFLLFCLNPGNSPGISLIPAG